MPFDRRVALLEFVLFYLVAGCFCRATGEKDSASYVVPSGFNNNVLGAVLAAIQTGTTVNLGGRYQSLTINGDDIPLVAHAKVGE